MSQEQEKRYGGGSGYSYRGGRGGRDQEERGWNGSGESRESSGYGYRGRSTESREGESAGWSYSEGNRGRFEGGWERESGSERRGGWDKYRGGRGGRDGGERGGERGGDGERDGGERGRGGRGRGGRGGRGRGGGRERPAITSTPALPADYKYPTIVDIGANLTHGKFQSNLDTIIQNAINKGVKLMIVTGTSIRSSAASVELCKQYPKNLHCTVGVHPHDAKTCNDNTIEEMKKLALDPSVCAIGECGLDFDRMFSKQEIQEFWFEKQLELAESLKKPVFLHERAAHSSFLRILKPFVDRGMKAVVHCFTGNEEELKQYLAIDNIKIGLTATFTHKNERGALLEQLIGKKLIPLEKLMIETDAPFMIPHTIPESFNYNPTTNEPSLLWCVCEALARLYGVSVEQVAEQTTRNALEFFEIDPR